MAEFEYKGIYGGVTDVAILAPTYPSVIPPRFANSGAIALAAFVPQVNSVMINLGNEVIVRESANTATGLHSAVIANRNVTGTMDPEAHLIASYDSFGEWLAGTERAAVITVGTAANNIQVYTVPKMQLISTSDGDRGGLQVDTWNWQANRSAADDDEFTLNFN